MQNRSRSLCKSFTSSLSSERDASWFLVLAASWTYLDRTRLVTDSIKTLKSNSLGMMQRKYSINWSLRRASSLLRCRDVFVFDSLDLEACWLWLCTSQLCTSRMTRCVIKSVSVSATDWDVCSSTLCMFLSLASTRKWLERRSQRF
jgi:hypothetical protein